MSGPWAEIQKPEPVSLAEIISEEVAKEIEAKRSKSSFAEKWHDGEPSVLYPLKPEETTSDEKFDFDSKSEEDIEEFCDSEEWDKFDSVTWSIKTIPVDGYKVKQKGNTDKKSDAMYSGLRDACKNLLCDEDLEVERARLRRINKYKYRYCFQIKEEPINLDFGIDEQSRFYICRKLKKGVLKRVNGIISVGSDGVILHADTNPEFDRSLPKEVAIKVFKTHISKFKQRDNYIEDDFRFIETKGKQKKKMFNVWAERESHNLSTLKKAGISCPEVVTLKKNILIMSFIGENQNRAPKLRDSYLTPDDAFIAYEQTVDTVKKLYQNANLIHGDLTEQNILWHDRVCYFIDVSHSIDLSHDKAFFFLYRDCYDVINFFSKRVYREILTPDELFEGIVGHPFTNRIALAALQEAFRAKVNR